MTSDAWMTNGEGHPRRWAALGVLVVSLLIVILDNTVLNIALPTLQEDLQATPSQLVWAVDSYILAFAALLFSWGVLGDRYGRKRILIIGMLIFGISSAICAFSVNAPMLIGFRAIMGIGGAAVLPTTLAIITVMFPPHERGKAIGLWAGAVGAAVAIGPVLGGFLLQHPDWSNWLTGNDWGSVFLINVPIVIIGIIGIIRIVPDSRNPVARKLDVPGLLISVTGLVLLVYGIIHASETGSWLTLSVLGPIIAGVVIIAVFLILESRSPHASFDVALFRNRGYAVSLIAVTLSFFALSGVTFSLPFYLQILRGYDTLTAGLFFVPFALGQLLAAPRSAKMVERFGYRKVMTTGLLVVALSMLGLLNLQLDSSVWYMLLTFFAFGFGMGNVIAPASTVMQNVLPLARVGAGSAVQNTVRQVGGALGVAVIGTVLATQYASNMRAVFAKTTGIPGQLQDTASQSIVAAATVVDQIQEVTGLPLATLQAGAFDAFLSAAHVASAISLGMIIVAALVVGFGLPNITPPSSRPLAPATGDGQTPIPAEGA